MSWVTGIGTSSVIARVRLPRKAVLLGVALFGFLLQGCYHNVSLVEAPPMCERISPADKAPDRPTAYVTSIQVELNGNPCNLAPMFEQRAIGRLQECQAFSDVMSLTGRPQPGTVHCRMSMKINETQHLYMAENVTKGIFVGLSLFLLAPVLPAHYEHEVNMDLTVELPAGTTKTYAAHARAKAMSTAGQHEILGITEAQGKAVEACLVSIANQLAADKRLFVPQ